MGLGDNIKNNTENQKNFNQSIKDGEESYRDYGDILKAINAELGKNYSTSKSVRKEYDGLISITSKLAAQEEGIVRLKDSQLEKLQQQAKANLATINHLAESLTYENAITEQEIALLVAKEDNFTIEKETLKKINESVEARKRANAAMGVAGNALKAITALSPALAKGLNLDKVKDDMQGFADKATEAGGSVSRLAVLGKGMTSALRNGFKTLTDPSVIIGTLIKGFKDVDKAAVDFNRTTGGDGNSFSTQIDAANSGFITMVDYLKTANALSVELGMNSTQIFTPEDLQESAKIVEALGMSTKEASQLAKFSKINGGTLRENNEAIVEGVNGFNGANKQGILAKGVLKDVANVSSDIGIAFLGYPEKLGEAGAAAAAIGTNLEGVQKMASSLLNFESSIAAEMEAELLTGQSLNLEKARELALTNDLAGVAKELGAQGITAASFGALNVIQQKAQAKALGMSTKEMADMLIQQDLSLGMSQQGLDDAQKQALSNMEAQEASVKMGKALDKIAQAMAPIVELAANILTSFMGIVSNVWVLYPLITAIAGYKLFTGLTGFAEKWKSIGSSIKDSWDDIKGMGEDSKSLLSNDQLKAGFGGKAAKDKAMGLPDPKMKPKSGAGIKDNLEGLGEGLKSMSGAKVTQGILNLALAGPALLLSLPSIPFLLFMGKVKLTHLSTNFTSLATGLGAMSGTTAGIGNLSLLALAGILMIPGSVGLLMAGGASFILAAGLTALAPALTLMANPAVAIGVGLLSLLALSLGVSFALVGAGAMMMGQGIHLASEGLSGMVPSIISLVQIIPALGLLGLALIGIGAGLALIGVGGIAALPALIALTALGTVLGPVSSMFGGEGETSTNGEGGGMAKVNKNLEKLISLVEAGGDVYIDGSKVGKTLQLSSSRMG